MFICIPEEILCFILSTHYIIIILCRVVPIAEISGLNHGIELSNGYLYASTPTTVYRWPYQTGQTTSNNVQEVIIGMGGTASNELGAEGGHKSKILFCCFFVHNDVQKLTHLTPIASSPLARTLAFDAEGKWLYVSIGSNGNVDADSFRSRIRRFDISTYVNQPFAYNDGEIFADGLRNEVGLAFDSYGDLWGVENGADNLYRSDLGGDM